MSGDSVVFNLDEVNLMSENAGHTRVKLRTGEEIEVPIELDEFCAKVYSDENLEKEYQLVDFDDGKPKPTLAGGFSIG